MVSLLFSTQCLWHPHIVVIDASNELDQAQFFQDYSDMVFDVMYKAYVDQTEKIRRKFDCEVFSSFQNIHSYIILLYIIIAWDHCLFTFASVDKREDRSPNCLFVQGVYPCK